MEEIMRATAVSIRADKAYINALRGLASDKDISVADMVRAALDNELGLELEPYLSFFAKSGKKNNRKPVSRS